MTNKIFYYEYPAPFFLFNESEQALAEQDQSQEEEVLETSHPCSRANRRSTRSRHYLNENSTTSLSEYTIQSLCGTGGYGEVYSAKHKQNQVAIKFFTHPKFGHKDAKKEIRMLYASKGLQNVLQLLSWGKDLASNRTFLVTELHTPLNLDSGNLQYIQRVSRGLFKGLAELHRNGIIHSDINPKNCLVNARGEGVLADLGCALYSDAKKPWPIQVVHYRDPRVFIDAPWDLTVDLWGIGCTLFELVMKEKFFHGHTDKEEKNAEFIRELHTLHLITTLLGPPSEQFLLIGKNYACYFDPHTLTLRKLPQRLQLPKLAHDFNSLKATCLSSGANQELTDHFVSLVGRLVTYGEKINATQALDSSFFTSTKSEIT